MTCKQDRITELEHREDELLAVVRLIERGASVELVSRYIDASLAEIREELEEYSVR